MKRMWIKTDSGSVFHHSSYPGFGTVHYDFDILHHAQPSNAVLALSFALHTCTAADERLPYIYCMLHSYEKCDDSHGVWSTYLMIRAGVLPIANSPHHMVFCTFILHMHVGPKPSAYASVILLYACPRFCIQ